MYEVEYNGQKMEYKLIKSDIKNIYIYIKNKQVIVKAPYKLKTSYITEFVNKKSKWIYKNIKNSPEIHEDKKIKQEDIEKLTKIVEEKIKEYSEKIGVNPNKVRIRNIKYAWGSCSNKKNITINMKLANKDEKVIEYVILHEMCHLVHMNHSKDFWKLVKKYMPYYKECRERLKKSS